MAKYFSEARDHDDALADNGRQEHPGLTQTVARYQWRNITKQVRNILIVRNRGIFMTDWIRLFLLLQHRTMAQALAHYPDYPSHRRPHCCCSESEVGSYIPAVV